MAKIKKITKNNNQIFLVNISGEDQPGLMHTLTTIFSDYNVNILDIGQAIIHNTLSLGILIEIPEESESSPILKDVLFKAHELDITIKFTPITIKEYSKWVESQGQDRYIITLFGRKLTAAQFSKITYIINKQGLNIDHVNRLSGRFSLNNPDDKPRACVELSVRGKPKQVKAMKKDFMDISHNYGVDIAFQADNIYRRNRRLVCFDMDSTIIQTEVIVELAKAAGVGDQVHEITEAAMRGEIDFTESFRRRVALLKGLDVSVMKSIAENLPITEGAERLLNNLRKFGLKTAILSGGFNYFGKYLQEKLGFDYVYANELEVKDGKLTGNYLGEVVDGNKKAELLKEIAFTEMIQLEQVIAIGDGANDLPMLNVAGLGIAFHAKPIVKESAKHAISTIGLDAILYFLGFRDREIF